MYFLSVRKYHECNDERKRRFLAEDVTNIELLEGTDENAVAVLSQQDSSITGAKLLNKVEKSYDKGTKLLSASKNVPDFMKVFHGSGAKFDKFDHSFMGSGEGARNYVIFNENDAQIESRIEFLRTSDGTTYGWAVNGTIYLTPEGLNPNTPIHEYTHLWAAALQKSNPKLWGEVVEAMKLSPAWNEVMADENYTEYIGSTLIVEG